MDTGSSQKMRQNQTSRELRDCNAIVKLSIALTLTNEPRIRSLID